MTANLSWGGLQHHWQPCMNEHEIEDDGTVYCDDSCSESNDADGRGFFWGSFYAEDIGECCFCETVGKKIAGMYEPPDEWVCLDCYLTHHADKCGCDLWPKESRNAIGAQSQ